MIEKFEIILANKESGAKLLQYLQANYTEVDYFLFKHYEKPLPESKHFEYCSFRNGTCKFELQNITPEELQKLTSLL